METQCPNCQTVFELADEDLNRADGKVRCGECATVFDARDHLTADSADDSQEDDPAFAETGVGWVLLPADEPVTDGDKDDAQYLSSDDDEGWQKVGRPQDSRASNTDADEPLRFDDNSPLPEDNLRLAETMAHETTPVVFKIVDAEPVEPEDKDDEKPAQAAEKEPAGEPGDTQDADPETDANANANENDDWAVLLAEIDDSNEPTDDAPAPATTTADNTLSDDTSTSDQDELAPADEAMASGQTTTADKASASTVEDHDGVESEPDDEDTQQPSSTVTGETADAEIDAGLLAALGGSDSDASHAGDFFDDVLAELPDRSSVDTPAVAMDDVPDAQPGDEDDGDEEVDSSGIFVQENVLPDEDELADVVPSAEAEASIVEAIDNKHFVDTGVSDVADTPGWLSEEQADPVSMRRQKLAVAALIGVGILQFAHFERNALASKPALNAGYQKIYGEALAPDWNINEICFEQRDALAENSRMHVVARFVNSGKRALPYPLLHVTLFGRFDDGDGNQTLGHAILEPADYLREDVAGQWLGPDVRFDAQAEFPDEQQQTTGYEVEVCYQGPDQTLICNGKC